MMLGEIADERKFFLPRLVNFYGIRIELYAIAGECAVFIEEAVEELFWSGVRDVAHEQKLHRFTYPLDRHKNNHQCAENGEGDVVEQAQAASGRANRFGKFDGQR